MPLSPQKNDRWCPGWAPHPGPPRGSRCPGCAPNPGHDCGRAPGVCPGPGALATWRGPGLPPPPLPGSLCTPHELAQFPSRSHQGEETDAGGVRACWTAANSVACLSSARCSISHSRCSISLSRFSVWRCIISRSLALSSSSSFCALRSSSRICR